MKTKPISLFISAFILTLLLGVIIHIFFYKSSTDVQIYDSYFMIRYCHICYCAALTFGLFTVIYLLYPKITGRYLTTALGRFHFTLTVLCLPIYIYLVMYIIFHFISDNAFSHDIERFSLIVLVLAITTQIPLLINLIVSIKKGEKV